MLSDLSSARRGASGPPLPPHDEDEVHIQRWVAVLLSRWTVLAAGAVVGALLGGLAAARTPTRYEAAATLLVGPPPDESGVYTRPSVRLLLNSQTIASAVVDELKLTQAGITAQTFVADVLTIEDIPNTQLVRVKVRLSDAQLAARAANRVAERGVELAQRVWHETMDNQRTELEKQVAEARARLLEAEARLSTWLQRDTSGGPRGGASQRSAGQHARTDTPFGEMQTDLEVKRRVYIDLGARHELLRLEAASKGPLVHVVDAAAVPDRPLPSGSKRTVALGLLAGLLLAGCIVVAREWQGRTLTAAER